jgi:hypothetical protein
VLARDRAGREDGGGGKRAWRSWRRLGASWSPPAGSVSETAAAGRAFGSVCRPAGRAPAGMRRGFFVRKQEKNIRCFCLAAPAADV